LSGPSFFGLFRSNVQHLGPIEDCSNPKDCSNPNDRTDECKKEEECCICKCEDSNLTLSDKFCLKNKHNDLICIKCFNVLFEGDYFGCPLCNNNNPLNFLNFKSNYFLTILNGML